MSKSKSRSVERPTPLARWMQAQMDAHHYQQKNLASMSGLDPSTIGGWLHGENDPDPTKVNQLIDALGAEREDVYRVIGWLRPAPTEYSATARQFLNRYSTLPEQVRRRAERYLDMLLDEQASGAPALGFAG
jgi:transcriptional regulator with XRE-family HTH domain